MHHPNAMNHVKPPTTINCSCVPFARSNTHRRAMYCVICCTLTSSTNQWNAVNALSPTSRWPRFETTWAATFPAYQTHPLQRMCVPFVIGSSVGNVISIGTWTRTLVRVSYATCAWRNSRHQKRLHRISVCMPKSCAVWPAARYSNLVTVTRHTCSFTGCRRLRFSSNVIAARKSIWHYTSWSGTYEITIAWWEVTAVFVVMHFIMPATRKRINANTPANCHSNVNTAIVDFAWKTIWNRIWFSIPATGHSVAVSVVSAMHESLSSRNTSIRFTRNWNHLDVKFAKSDFRPNHIWSNTCGHIAASDHFSVHNAVCSLRKSPIWRYIWIESTNWRVIEVQLMELWCSR